MQRIHDKSSRKQRLKNQFYLCLFASVRTIIKVKGGGGDNGSDFWAHAYADSVDHSSCCHFGLFFPAPLG